jgi:hypothetical protein
MSKKDAYYFSHDANSQDDPKCMLLIDQMGMEGYGIFWALIEKLRSEKDYKLPINILPSLAKRWGTSKEKVETVVKNYSLFVVEHDEFFSIRLQRSMLERSEKARVSAGFRWNNATALQSHSEGSANGMRNDANKGKESKEKKSILLGDKPRKIMLKPDREEVINYLVDEKNKDEFTAHGIADAFMDHFESNGWKVGKAKAPMQDWKASVRTWLRNGERINPIKTRRSVNDFI